MAVLKQSTAYTRMFKMISSSDHISAKATASPVVNISKAGAAFGAAGGAVTEISNGWYKVALNTTDTNTLGDLAFYITGTGADDTDFVDQVTANILGDTLPVNVAQWNGTNVAAPATAGIPDVNVKNAGNTAWASGSLTSGVFAAGAVNNAAIAADTGLKPVRSNTAQAGAGTTITLDASASATNNAYQGMLVYLTGGTGIGGTGVITNYVGATKVATISGTWQAGNPDGTTTFAIIPADVNVESWHHVAAVTDGTYPSVNTAAFAGNAAQMDVNNLPSVNVKDWNATAVGSLPANFSSFSIDASGRVDLAKWIGVAPLALSAQQVQAVVPSSTVVASVTNPVTLTSAYDFAKGTTAMTESYNADGVAPTPAQALFMCMQMLGEFAIVGTTLTLKKLDGVTTAGTFTLDSSTSPTSITRTG